MERPHLRSGLDTEAQILAAGGGGEGFVAVSRVSILERAVVVAALAARCDRVVCLTPEEADEFAAALSDTAGAALGASDPPVKLHGPLYSGDGLDLDRREVAIIGGRYLGLFCGAAIVRGQP